jgi:hypothetical protein
LGLGVRGVVVWLVRSVVPMGGSLLGA